MFKIFQDATCSQHNVWRWISGTKWSSELALKIICVDETVFNIIGCGQGINYSQTLSPVRRLYDRMVSPWGQRPSNLDSQGQDEGRKCRSKEYEYEIVWATMIDACSNWYLITSLQLIRTIQSNEGGYSSRVKTTNAKLQKMVQYTEL